MTLVEQSVLVPYPPAYVYALLADLGAARRWRPGVHASAVAPPGLARAGTLAIHHFEKRDERIEVLDADAPRHLALRVEGRRGKPALLTWTLEPEQGGTRVTRRIEASTPIPFLSRRRLERAADEELAALAGALDALPRPRAALR